jgi:hypothetical protein
MQNVASEKSNYAHTHMTNCYEFTGPTSGEELAAYYNSDIGMFFFPSLSLSLCLLDEVYYNNAWKTKLWHLSDIKPQIAHLCLLKICFWSNKHFLMNVAFYC